MDDKTRNRIRLFASPRGMSGLGWHVLRRAGAIAGPALAGPNQIRLNPYSHLCNLKCTMCNLQQLPREELARLRRRDRAEAMTLADYRRLLRRPLPGLVSVNITGGGEPLLHPEIIGIMAEVKRRGLAGSLITNGLALNAALAEAAVAMAWDGIRFSVHAGDKDTYARISGVDAFDRVRNNLLLLDRCRKKQGSGRRPRIVLFVVIQRENISALENIFAFARSTGVDHLEFERLIPFAPEARLSTGELAAARRNLAAGAASSPVSCNLPVVLRQLAVEGRSLASGPFRPARRCSVGYDQVFVASNGDVYPCCFSDEKMGNLRRSTLSQIWHNRPYAAFRRRLMHGRFAPYCIANRCALPGVLHQW